MTKYKNVWGIVAVLIAGFLFGTGSQGGGVLGGVIGPAASLSNNTLRTALHDLAYDTVNVRKPLAGLAVASSSVNWGTLVGNTGANASSSVLNIPGGGTIGDLCIPQVAAAASSTVNFRCEVTATAVTNASGTVYATAVGTSTSALGTLTTRIWVLPVSSFVAPGALTVSTSTAANQ